MMNKGIKPAVTKIKEGFEWVGELLRGNVVQFLAVSKEGKWKFIQKSEDCMPVGNPRLPYD